MKKRLLFLLTVFLAGCATGSRNTVQSNIYDFGQPELLITGEAKAAISGRIALDVWAVPWIDTTHIDYRLDYDNPLKRRQYADSRWAASPRTLMAQQLRRQFGFVGVNDGIAVNCLLRVELYQFSHVFRSVQDSWGVLHGQFNLIDGKRRVVAVHPVNIEVAAAAANAQEGIRALVQTGLDMGQELVAWMNQLEKNNGLGSCGLVFSGKQ